MTEHEQEMPVLGDGPSTGGPSTGAGRTGGLPRPGRGATPPDDELASTVGGLGRDHDIPAGAMGDGPREVDEDVRSTWGDAVEGAPLTAEAQAEVARRAGEPAIGNTDADVPPDVDVEDVLRAGVASYGGGVDDAGAESASSEGEEADAAGTADGPVDLPLTLQAEALSGGGGDPQGRQPTDASVSDQQS